jgi:hypothetical protein
MYHRNRMGNGNDDISSEKDFENSKTITGSYMYLGLSVDFLSKYLNSIS